MKKVLRTLTLALLALFASTTVRAADHVKVSEKDGKTTIFALSDDPTVTFTATDLVITAGTMDYVESSSLNHQLNHSNLSRSNEKAFYTNSNCPHGGSKSAGTDRNYQ